MANILCIETSQDYCSICIHNMGTELYSAVSTKAYGHTTDLSVMIQKAFREVDRASLVAIAVSIGPGSYTGLRVGVSTAKGLCYGLNIPFISVPTLQIISVPFKGNYDYIIPTMDARRNEVYTATYDLHINEVKSAHCHIIHEQSFESHRDKRAIICGNGAEKVKTILNGQGFTFESNPPLAKNMSSLSYQAYTDINFANTIDVIPIYLKSPNITTQKKNILTARKS